MSEKAVQSKLSRHSEVGTKKKIPCEIYSRVVGYFRPVGQWNLGKRSEFQDRKDLKVPEVGDLG